MIIGIMSTTLKEK